MRSTSIISASAAIILSFASSTSAFWRMECRSSAGMARMDPLVNPGEPGTHVHDVFGSGGFSMTSKTSDLLASDCTSCKVKEDKSAYWTPQLYFQHADGTFEAVTKAGGMLAYYFLNKDGNEKIQAFPEGFQMIAGTNTLRTFDLPVPDPPKSLWGFDPAQSSQAALAQKAIGFNCLNYAKAPEGSLQRHFLPDKAFMDANCADGVRVELMFPSCWNGQADSADHKSHVAYPTTVMDGFCPSTHPTRLPGLFYEVIYNTNAFAGVDGKFVFANGDTTGYGFHGDFIMGWDNNLLQNAVDTCTNPSGMVEDCPLFTILDPNTYSQCKFPIPSSLAKENVLSPGTKLPGSDGYVDPDGTPSASAVPTLSVAPGTTIATGSNFVPGGIFIASATSQVVSNAPAPSPASSASAQSMASIQTVANPPAPAATTPSNKVAAAPSPPSSPAAAATPTTLKTAVAQAPAATTPKPAPAAFTGPGKIITTSYITQANQVLELVVVQEEVTVYAQVTQTATVTVAPKGRRAPRRHLGAHLGGREAAAAAQPAARHAGHAEAHNRRVNGGEMGGQR